MLSRITGSISGRISNIKRSDLPDSGPSKEALRDREWIQKSEITKQRKQNSENTMTCLNQVMRLGSIEGAYISQTFWSLIQW